MRSSVYILACALFAAALPAIAQSGKTPDLSGLWDGAQATGDIARALPKGQKIPFTPMALEKYKNIDMATNPHGMCLPPGPSRAITGPSPMQFVQTPGILTILFENHFMFRIIYLDGTKHPADVADYPTFMGHSTGKWEGDTLVIDSVGFNEKQWAFGAYPNTRQMHIIERISRPDLKTISYEATLDDPGAYTKPWTAKWTITEKTPSKWIEGGEMFEYICEDATR